jgi:histidine kinase
VAAEQVFVNLLLNARDVLQDLPDGAPRRIGVTSRVEGDDVVVTVADTGGGIPPALMERLFEPFFTTKPVGQGTGLGLSICHGIMRAFGGGITATNGEAGAEMAVRFRTAPPAGQAPGQGAATSPALGAPVR